VRVREGALQVTASSDDQAAISQFIHLLQARAAKFTKGAPKVNSLRNDVKSGPLPEGPNSARDPNFDAIESTPRPDFPLREKADTLPSNESVPAATPAKR